MYRPIFLPKTSIVYKRSMSNENADPQKQTRNKMQYMCLRKRHSYFYNYLIQYMQRLVLRRL